MDLQNRLHDIQKRIQDAAVRSGRDPADVALLAVTKTFPAETIRAAYDLGLRTFGENRVQEAIEKMTTFPADACWHLIGQLQTNKINKTLGRFALIQSIDSVDLAEAFSKRQVNGVQDILLEVNTSGETAKSGVRPDQTLEAAKKIAALPGLQLKGLMTVGPLTEDVQKQREAFKKLKELFDSVRAQSWSGNSFATISMGMSGDFEMAIEEGSTLVRVGSALFGSRT
jgi:pyridoxal phosphate enzyme (YggS family)